MATGIRRHPALLITAVLALLVAWAIVATPGVVPGLWWTRNLVHWAKVKNYVGPPNYFSNQKLQDVWLAED